MRTGVHFILKDGVPVDEPDVLKWAAWFEKADRRVAFTPLLGYEVSTVFLGLNHSWGDGPPLLFETMVFKSEVDSDGRRDTADEFDMDRYATLEEAMQGHDRIVAQVRARIPA